MDKLEIALKMLKETAQMQIYSSPGFMMETFCAIVISLIFLYLHFEITRIARDTLLLKPHTIFFKDSCRGSYSKESICTSVTRVQHEFCKYRRYGRLLNQSALGGISYRATTHSTHSQLEWLLNQNINRTDMLNPLVEERQGRHYLHSRLAALTPQEFVRLDLEHSKRQRDVKSAMDSLSALYETVISRKISQHAVKEKLQNAKEHLQCMKYTVPMRFLETQNLTESLFNILEKHIISSSIENPLAFKGDFTSLAYETGKLSYDLISNTTDCDLMRESSKDTLEPNTSDGAMIEAVGHAAKVLNAFQ